MRLPLAGMVRRRCWTSGWCTVGQETSGSREIERWNRTVREHFLVEITGEPDRHFWLSRAVARAPRSGTGSNGSTTDGGGPHSAIWL